MVRDRTPDAKTGRGGDKETGRQGERETRRPQARRPQARPMDILPVSSSPCLLVFFLSQTQSLTDDDFQLADLLPAETFTAPDDVVALVDEKCGGEIADAELSPNGTRLLIAAQQNPIVHAISLPGAADFQDLILRRRVAFVVDADHFQSIPAITILQRIQIFDGHQTMRAPSAPEIEQHEPALMVSKLPRLPIQIIEGEVIERVPGQHTAWNPRRTGRHGRRWRHLRSNLGERIGAHLRIVFDDPFRPENHGTWRSLRDRGWRGRRRPEYSRRRS